MGPINPYESTSSVPETLSPRTRRSTIQRLLIGFALGATPPAALGIYGLHQFSVYVASLPPGRFACGNDALGSVLLIVIVAPVLGLIGALIANHLR